MLEFCAPPFAEFYEWSDDVNDFVEITPAKDGGTE